DQVYGAVPPLACRRLEYDEPFVPEGKLDVVIARAGAAMASERVTDLLCAGLDTSMTLKVRLDVPLPVGVPEIVPLLAAKARPVGRVPLVMDQVYGAVPPVALSALL